MQFKDKLVQKYNNLRPYLSRTVSSTAQGYVFGCMVGLFTKEEKSSVAEMLKHVNKSGCKFATVGAIYSTTENILEGVRKKRCPFNSVIAGAISASIVSRKNGNPILSGTGFGFYSGISELNRHL